MLTVLAVALLTLSLVPTASAAPMKGDVNGNGAVDLGDVILALRIAVGTLTPTADQMTAADVAPVVGWGHPVGDKRVTVADAVRILRSIVGLVAVQDLEPVPTGARYLGADVCKACHSGKHTDWQTTRHKDAYTNLKAYEGGANANNPVCLACHTVGFGQEGGFVDEQTTPGLGGVQCESCHGPGSLHVQGGGDKTKILGYPKALAAQVCGKCHTGSRQPHYDEWVRTRHSDIDAHVAAYFAQGRYADRCGICHSGEVRMAVIEEQPLPDAKTLTLGITCAVCHSPHKAKGNDPEPRTGHDSQLRLTTASQDVTKPTLCGQCHTRRDDDVWTKTSRPPHHSGQFAFLLGTGGFLKTEDQPRTMHVFVQGQCVKCHMYRKPFESEEKPTITGHSYKADVRACSPCHTPEAAEAMIKSTHDDISGQLAALKTRLDSWGNWEFVSSGGPQDQSVIPDQVKQARWNYYWVLNDGSGGVHNAKYARELIKTANALLDEIGVAK